MKVNDFQNIKKKIEGIEVKELKEYLAALDDENFCFKTIKDFEGPGKEVKAGSRNCIDLSESSLMERIIHESNLLPVHFLTEGAVVQKAVGRITKNGRGWGTGFLISDRLVMTNNHVIDGLAGIGSFKVEFNFQDDHFGNSLPVDRYDFKSNGIFHTNADLDYTIIEVVPKRIFSAVYPGGSRFPVIPARSSIEYTPHPDDPNPVPPFPPFPVDPGLDPVIPRLPIDIGRIGPIKPWIFRYPGTLYGFIPLNAHIQYVIKAHINIIQHPRGRRKEVAVQHNELTNVYTDAVRYTTDTEPGSSGSPVFNNSWDLIALHHAAGTWDSTTNRWVSNEGMRLDSIISDLQSHYGNAADGQQVLTALGI